MASLFMTDALPRPLPRFPQRQVHVAGLGCGNGYKEARLLRLLAAQGRELSYVPCDVSLPLVLAAAHEAQNACSSLLLPATLVRFGASP